MNIALTIAGFDPSSGAGITADLAVFAAHGLFGTACITALTVQSTLGVRAVHPVGPTLVRDTLDCLCSDLPPAGIKLGMLADQATVVEVAAWLTRLRQNLRLPIVLDPVLRSTSGHALLAPDSPAYKPAGPPSTHPTSALANPFPNPSPNPVPNPSPAPRLNPPLHPPPAPPTALDALRSHLLPVVDWITPNHAELAALLGRPPFTAPDRPTLETAARDLQRLSPSLTVLVTGGDQHPPDDLLVLPSGEAAWLSGAHVATTSTHGTGCALSSALLAQLIAAAPPLTAARAAKHFVAEALRRAPGLGHGRGPADLLWPLDRDRAAQSL